MYQPEKTIEPQKQVDYIEILRRIAGIIGSNLNIEDAFGEFSKVLSELVYCHRIGLGILEEGKPEIKIHIIHYRPEGIVKEQRILPLEHTSVPFMQQNMKPIIQKNLKEGVLFESDKKIRDEGIRTILRIPVVLGEKYLGVLLIGVREIYNYTQRDIDMLRIVAIYIALTVETLRLYERTREAEKFEEADRLKTQLLSMVSHELRTPLTVIKGYSSMLIKYGEQLPDTEKRLIFKEIDTASDKLKELIDNLLEMSRLEMGTLKLNLTAFDMGEIIRLAIEAVKQKTEKHKFSLSIPPDLPQVYADPSRIELVVNSLLMNAVKFSPNGGEVKIVIIGKEKEVVVSVNDTGIGIAPEVIDKIFDKFYQFDPAIKTATKGLGLGLTVINGIIEAHGGRVWVESTPGRGSTFCFTLPLTRAAELGSGI